MAIISMQSMICVVVQCIFFDVRTEFLIITQTRFGFKGLMDSTLKSVRSPLQSSTSHMYVTSSSASI
jgi:hypothetical protein